MYLVVAQTQKYGYHKKHFAMNVINCPYCKKEFELSDAFKHQIEETILAEEREKQKEYIDKIAQDIKLKTEKRVKDEMETQLKDTRNENSESKEKINKLSTELLDLTKLLRTLKEKDQQRDLEMQKQLIRERDALQKEIEKNVTEKAGVEIAEMRKQLDDTKKALEDAQRKAAQKSQQLQGEVFELELEAILKNTFHQDEIEPVGKGVSGADIRQLVKSPKGYNCGTILWELKRTKEWSEKWISKLKDDARSEKAMFCVIVSSILPKQAEDGLGIVDGVWLCNPKLIVPLAMILRRNLLDIGYQKAISHNKEEKSEFLYTYITSHEFQQQVESILEVYQQMQEQIQKERLSFERSWKQRETQVQKILLGTANIIGSMQGVVGASMPPIKGLELPQLDEEIPNLPGPETFDSE